MTSQRRSNSLRNALAAFVAESSRCASDRSSSAACVSSSRIVSSTSKCLLDLDPRVKLFYLLAFARSSRLQDMIRTQPVQGLVSDSVRTHVDPQTNLLKVHGLSWTGVREYTSERRAWYVMVHDSHEQLMRRLARKDAFGPLAPRRHRPKRVAKKLAQRGGMLRCKGLIQNMHRAWPAMIWFGGMQ